DAASQATAMVGYELGMINNKTNDYVGYGFDCVNLGSYGIGAGFQTRGNFNVAFTSNTGAQYGFVSYDAEASGFYSSSDVIGGLFEGNSYGIQIQGSTAYCLTIQDSNNKFLTGINSSGAIESLRYSQAVISVGGTIGIYSTINFATPAKSGDSINLPTPSAGRFIYVRNLSTTIALSLLGTIDPTLTNTGSITLATATTIQLYSDGIYWYPMSQS
ncbi:hypothetical protein, partial [Serratia sp. M24T3]|uniref:hypothetical protein n=1 Tax=Serratia sp. M24T3 TaxID=932213 RepID=UPI00025B9EDF